MIRLTRLAVALVATVALSLPLAGCGAGSQRDAATASAEKAGTVAWGAAKALRAHFDATLDAEHKRAAERIVAELEKSGGSLRDYDAAIAAWENEGWAAKMESTVALGTALRLIEAYMETGTVSRANALLAVDTAIAAAAELVRYKGLPDELSNSLELIRFGLRMVVTGVE